MMISVEEEEEQGGLGRIPTRVHHYLLLYLLMGDIGRRRGKAVIAAEVRVYHSQKMVVERIVE